MGTGSPALPASLQGPLDVLMIDNFDSFTWNLYQSLELLGAKVTVIRNDAIPSHALRLLRPRSLIISPGPGHPRTDSGISRDAVKYFVGKIPVLGVCMGLQCIVDLFGGQISYAGEIKHGKVSPVRHDGRGVFRDVPQSFLATRYHSLSSHLTTLPAVLQVSAATADSGVIMGVRHRTYTLESVQYHPESIMCEQGDAVLKNFLALKSGTWEENAAFGVLDSNLPPFPLEALNPAPPVENGNGEAVHVKKETKDKIPSILEKIYAQRLRDVESAKAAPGTSLADLDALLALHVSPPLVPLVSRLKARAPALMAEIKRASPSKGSIAPDANAAQQALKYALAGASVVSVLTEPTWFKGSLLDMRLARAAVDSLPNRPAILRKDFILDEYQIAEARVHGADTVLLIVAMLPPTRLTALYQYSLSLGMEPLVEVNNAVEMERALELGARVIGVNNRNLHSFDVDMGTTSRLADMVRSRDVILCALSGISGPEDVRTYVGEGVGAVLVGEALMRAPDTGAFIRELLDWPAPPQKEAKAPLVKICGVRSVDEARAVAEAGVDMIGLMFAERSKRRISTEVAGQIAAAIRAARAPYDGEEDEEHDEDADLDSESLDWFGAQAQRLERTVSRTRPLLVGVFQNQPLSYVTRVCALAQLDIVQLHGSEPAEWARHIPIPVLRAFAVGDAEVSRPGLHAFALLDAAGADRGTGKVVDWKQARAVVEGGVPVVLAGGLTPDNVAEAVKRVRPWAVDVSGGVEAEEGGKDARKVKKFVDAVKACVE